MATRNYLYCKWDPIRPKKQIYEMLLKMTAIAQAERQQGNIEHAQLMTAVGVGLRWVLYDWDFGLEDLTKPNIVMKKEKKK